MGALAGAGLRTALPWIAKGAGALGAGLLGRSAASNATKQSPGEAAAAAGGTGAAKSLTGQAADRSGQAGTLAGIGTPALQQSSGYYSKILGGSQAGLRTAVAPELNASADLYRGTNSGINSRMVGPQRDVALADTSRAAAGTYSNILGSARPMAAAAQGGLGLGATGASLGAAGQAIGATQGAGSIYSGLLGNATGARLAGNEQQQKVGADTGNMIFKILSKGKTGGDSGGGGGGAPSWTGPTGGGSSANA
jgi:hypothetical protein